MESLLETAAGGIGAALGTAITSPALATALTELLPDALFFRCGANLATWRGAGSGWSVTAAPVELAAACRRPVVPLLRRRPLHAPSGCLQCGSLQRK